mgnify:FL=1|tara:strand:- start:84 stop:581 length:498 start_codon:yes stop_codon:yes gene_type:complete
MADTNVATQVIVTSSNWWDGPLMLLTVLFPIMLASTVLVGIIVFHKRSNRSLGNKPIATHRIVKECMIVGVLIGGLFQWLLHDIVVAITGMQLPDDVGLKLLILSACVTGPLGQLKYHLLRWWAKSRNHTGLYQFITVKHMPEIDYTDDDVSDMTVKNWKDSDGG